MGKGIHASRKATIEQQSSWERSQQALLGCFGVPGWKNDLKLGKMVGKGSATTRWEAVKHSEGAATPLCTKTGQQNKIMGAPGGLNSSSNGHSRAYGLWIESSDVACVIPTVSIEVTDLGSAQSEVKGELGDLTGQVQIWRFSVSFSSGKRLFLSENQFI